MNRLLEPGQAQKIQQKANELLAKYRQVSDPYELVSKIASDHEVRIMEADLYEMSGALRKESDHWVIYVNRSDSQQRKLFTIAHELGHFFVHRDLCDEFVDSQFVARDNRERHTERELEANEFAGNLIMPELEVRERVSGNITEDTLLSLARSFGVSAIAMETRLRNLGYATPH
ncbi:ImmA/IrrE family metallo-endopeptidase [Candidatus Peregrinibacteria bacterium]|nr:ImmA/IrrE family metallo-endopeptidase [Candidatus Peregrinibacteria bacterium]MBI3816975.1 ImmA/IrrE family metallo-endopeptidase [Candidatus Peregrinibacteria bacterium]